MASHRHHQQINDTRMPAPTRVQPHGAPLIFRTSEAARLEEMMRTQLIEFTAHVGLHRTPAAVLDALDEAIKADASIMVLGAKRFAVNLHDVDALEVGHNVFIHRSVPEGWWDEYFLLSKKAYAPILMMARHCMAPFTWTECLRMLEPIGIDRWAHELGLKYGMRDGLTCPVAARWVIVYWSRKVLCKLLSPQLRALLFMAATFAAIRLEQIVGPDPARVGKRMSLTPRELSVMRLASNGHRIKRIAELLELGEETVRTHAKKAQLKLGARDRTHAVAEALRRQLIP